MLPAFSFISYRGDGQNPRQLYMITKLTMLTIVNNQPTRGNQANKTPAQRNLFDPTSIKSPAPLYYIMPANISDKC